jgi:hypothetical protein
MLRWLTAGESHGPSLVAILEGLPAHVRVTTDDLADSLARRRLGYGRGARMKFEQDQVRVLGGVVLVALKVIDRKHNPFGPWMLIGAVLGIVAGPAFTLWMWGDLAA